MIRASCLAAIGLAAMTGCQNPQAAPVEMNPAMLDSLAVPAILRAQVDDAVLAQRTLYPCHFVRDGDALNELGQRDLRVLAAHLRVRPGRLTVHPGDAPADLVARRVQAVLAALAREHVPSDRVVVVDEPPGGDGMAARRVLVIQDRAGGPLAESANLTTGP